MATVKLLPGKVFEIHLPERKKDNGEVIPAQVIRGKYSVWAYRRFCMKMGWTDQKLITKLSDDQSSWTDNVEMILCAVEHFFRENGDPFKYNDFDVCEWIEELGGISSDQYIALIQHAGSDLKTDSAEGEKKTEGS